MKIVALVDDETVADDDPQFEGRDAATRARAEFHVMQALRDLGHSARAISFGPDILQTQKELLDAAPELVFNLTEHAGGDRRGDADVAGLLDLLRVPYTGTGPAGMVLCRDKATCKRVLGYHRIRVPAFCLLAPGHPSAPRAMRYPAIVKPLYEDGSDGISLSSLIREPAELANRVKMIHERMKQPAIAEEYVEGRELYVSVIGNGTPRVLPPRELRFGNPEGRGPHIATARVKWDEEYRKKWNISYGPAELDAPLARRIASLSRRIYELLQIRDYGRIDLRLTPGGDLVFLEANPNPDLSSDGDLGESARADGLPYGQLIDRIVHFALRRKR